MSTLSESRKIKLSTSQRQKVLTFWHGTMHLVLSLLLLIWGEGKKIVVASLTFYQISSLLQIFSYLDNDDLTETSFVSKDCHHLAMSDANWHVAPPIQPKAVLSLNTPRAIKAMKAAPAQPRKAATAQPRKAAPAQPRKAAPAQPRKAAPGPNTAQAIKA